MRELANHSQIHIHNLDREQTHTTCSLSLSSFVNNSKWPQTTLWVDHMALNGIWIFPTDHLELTTVELAFPKPLRYMQKMTEAYDAIPLSTTCMYFADLSKVRQTVVAFLRVASERCNLGIWRANMSSSAALVCVVGDKQLSHKISQKT